MTKQINIRLLAAARWAYATAIQRYRYQEQESNWMEYAMRDTLLTYERAKEFRADYVGRQIGYMLRAPFEYFKAIKAVNQYYDWIAPDPTRLDIKYRAWVKRGQWFDITFDYALHCVKLTASTGRVYFL